MIGTKKLGLLATEKVSPAEKTVSAAKTVVSPSETHALDQYRKVVTPILQERCHDCRGDGSRKGGLALDELTTEDQVLRNPHLWLKVLRTKMEYCVPLLVLDLPLGKEKWDHHLN